MAITDAAHPVPDASPAASAAQQACLHSALRLPDDKARAWIGFLATHAELTRALDAGLAAEFGLSLSAVEVMARIVWEPEGRLRMCDLAESALLSQSRVSRIVDWLEARGLVERRSCPSDSRGVYAHITDPGRDLISRALEWHWTQVQQRFFATLSDEQVRELGTVWDGIRGGRLDAPDTSTCPNAG